MQRERTYTPQQWDQLDADQEKRVTEAIREGNRERAQGEYRCLEWVRSERGREEGE